MSTKEIKCPICLTGKLSWHDTNAMNQTDQGTGDPYFMCSDQFRCGLVVSTRTNEGVRKAYERIMR